MTRFGLAALAIGLAPFLGATAVDAAIVDWSTQILNGNAMASGSELILSQANTDNNSSGYLANQFATNQSFNLTFSFDMHQYGALMADGISFIVQSSGANALGNSGGGLGAEGIMPSAGVAFRSFIYNQAQIFTGGVIASANPILQSSDFQLSTVPAVLGTNYIAQGNASINYDANNHTLSYSAINNSNGSTATGSAFVDLSSLGSLAYFGFTGATGSSSAFQSVDNVSFNVVPAVPECGTWAMMFVGFGAIGAVMRRSRNSVMGSVRKLAVA